MAKTNDALKILQQMTSEDPELEKMIQESSLNAELAQLIYQARTQAGLTQQQLADRIGTKQSVIARLEDAEYEGHRWHKTLSKMLSMTLAKNCAGAQSALGGSPDPDRG